MDVCVGTAGKVQDAKCSNSSRTGRTLFPLKCSDVDGVSVPTWLLADPLYSLHPWLNKPLPDLYKPNETQIKLYTWMVQEDGM